MANKTEASDCYKGNPALPVPATEYEWTPEMVAELKKCSKTILHFAENHFYITTLDYGKQKIQLYPAQKRILKSLKKNRFVALLASRQIGKSTLMTIFALWTACFTEDQNILIIANKESTAINILRRIRLAYEMLPNYLKPGVKEYGKTSLTFSNDSRISISTTTSSAARGESVNVLIIDEMAFIPTGFMDEFWKSVMPVISSSKKSKIFAVSTPNGTLNKFYEVYTAGEKNESGWSSERVDWWEVPGRDDKWKDTMIKNLGSKEAFAQEFGNVFAQSGESAVDAEVLEHFRTIARKPDIILEDGDYKIWEEPQDGHIYTLGIDVSEGIGRANSVIQILDITDPMNIEQVAVYSNNKIEPFHFASKIFTIANQWGAPPVLVERNNMGGQVIDALVNTHKYENIVEYSPDSQKGYGRLGVYSHTNTKYKGVMNMRYWVNHLRCVNLYDINTIQEIETFVRYPNGTWKKQQGESIFDDRVLALIWAVFILETDLAETYLEIVEYDEQGKPLKISSPFAADSSKFVKLGVQAGADISAPENVPPNFLGITPGSTASEMDDMMFDGWTMWTPS